MSALPRVVSLLPSATEIVCALGLERALVGVSHECDFPPAVAHLPRVTGTRVTARGTAAIEREVRELTASALSLYPLDRARLAELAPDVVVTQDLCAVCAVPASEVEAALAELGLARTRVVALSPLSLADVWRDVERVAEALGCAERGRALARELRARCAALAARVPADAARPRVVTLEWLEPVMIGGTWMPELVALAGGVALGARAGERAPVLALAELATLAPDVVLVKPCGFELARTRAERALVDRVVAALGGTARACGAVFVADGSAFFNRPGPRLVESLEILAACVHPETFAELASRHAAAFERWRAAPRAAAAADDGAGAAGLRVEGHRIP